jgi:hypothetical protein
MLRFLFGLTLIAVPACLSGACAALHGGAGRDGSYRNPSMYIMVNPDQPIPNSCGYKWGMHYFRVRDDEKTDLAEVDERLRSAIKRELHRHGYNEVEDNPELMVSFAAALNADLDETAFNEAYGAQFKFPFPPENPDEKRVYSKGSLVIDVLDAKTMKLLWRGTILADVDMSVTKREKDRRVRKAVRALLNQFPKLVAAK